MGSAGYGDEGPAVHAGPAEVLGALTRAGGHDLGPWR
jgi:hypothetical protein